MTPKRQAKALAKWHHNFQSVKRIFDTDNQPTGLKGANTELAPYLAFKGVLEMNSYIDIIANQRAEQAVGQDLTFQEFMQPLKEDLENLLEECKNGTDPGKAINKPSPVKCLQEYSQDRNVRRFANQVVELCTKPTLIPVLNKHIAAGESDNRNASKIAPKAFVLAYAVQILLLKKKVVEETQHDELGQLQTDVEGAGRGHVRKLYTKPVKSKLPDVERNGASDVVGGQPKQQKPRLNFGEHRRGVLTSFDYRNHKVLNPDEPVLHGTGDEFKEAVKAIKDPDLIRTTSQLEREKKKDAKETPVVVGVKQVYHLVQNDPHGRLSFFYKQTSDDPSTRTPDDRPVYLYWLCYKSPVMTRALELAWRYVREQNQRVLVYVDTPWIQWPAFVMQYDAVPARRPGHGTNERSKVIAGWNDPTSGDEIFVAFELHYLCGDTTRSDRRYRSIQLKLALRTQRSVIASGGRLIMVPEWMTDQLREICIFELIKTSWNQPFDRYAWVVERLLTSTLTQLWHTCYAMFETAISEVKEEVKTGPEMQARLEKTNEKARRRSDENQLSDEFVFDSDADDEEDSDVENVAQEEEDALQQEELEDDSETDDGEGSSEHPKGVKRKATGDRRGGTRNRPLPLLNGEYMGLVGIG
ncbi:hypothetical protein FLAG1_09825 [Fusarium langsethiae]|uniref:Uncharacterized protein n=1 Tax=Fusarium langsethiae TaxID=179993 RepID=A0A0M9EQ68_FUSLA|nr:hypothetical protein FLAG1_09825 [Fusarium langsethiae]